MTLNPWRLARRRRCHGSFVCCQHVDQPMCNSWDDPHRLARRRFRRQVVEDDTRPATHR